MRTAIVFEARREGYGIDQIREPIIVRELKEILEDFDDDTLFILSHDNGYTYGSVSRYEWEEYEEDEDGNWAEQEI